MSNPASDLIVNEHHMPDGRSILVVCDADIIGKVFEEGNKILDMSVGFYKGVVKTREEIIALIRTAYILNLTGKHAIAFAKEKGLITDENIITIGGCPHAECLIPSNE